MARSGVLRSFTYESLYEALSKNGDDFVSYLQDLGLLHDERTCRKCGLPSSPRHDLKSRCPHRKNCGKPISNRIATMFERSHLTLKQIFELSYYWCRANWEFTEVAFQTQTFKDSQLSHQTWTDWTQFFRDVCAEFSVENVRGGRDKGDDVFYLLWDTVSRIYPVELHAPASTADGEAARPPIEEGQNKNEEN